MLRVAWRSLRAHKLRLLLSTIAVTLGVAFVGGSYVFTDTLQRTFTDLFGQVSPDVTLTPKPAFSGADQTSDAATTLPSSLVTKVAAVDGVAKARGGVFVNGVAVVGRNGKVVGTGNAPTFGVAWSDDTDLSPLRIAEGRGPTAPGEIALDTQTADKGDFKVGERVAIITPKGRSDEKLVGIFRFGNTGNLAGASLTAFDLPTAERILTAPGRLTSIDAKAEPGVSQAVLAQRVKQVVPSDVRVQTGKEAADEQAAQVNSGLKFFNILFLAFAAIALLVGIFLILNTFAMLVAQRARELALLRALGASRSQVTRSMLTEALAVGLVGSAAGFAVGIGIAVGIKAALSAFGVDLSTGSLVILPRTVVVCFVVGVGVTLLAALLPARRAARVPPVAAMRDTVTIPSRSLHLRTIIGSVVTALGALALLGGVEAKSGGTGAGLVGLGALLALVGVAIVAPVIARPAVAVVGYPIRRLSRLTGRLAVDNAGRNRRRTAGTASALMIGLAVVSTFAILGASINASIDQVIKTAIGADFVVAPSKLAGAGISPAIERELAAVPGVATTTPTQAVPAKVRGTTTQVFGIDGATISDAFKLGFVQGSAADLGPGTIGLDSHSAADSNLKIGDRIPVVFETGPTTLRLAALYERAGPFSGYISDLSALKAAGIKAAYTGIYLNAAPGASTTDVRAGIDKALAPYPTVKVQDQAEYKASLKSQVNQLLGFVYVLLALSIVIAILGIVNTLALSVIERTREIGLLRAVGMLRKQLRRTVTWESVVIAVFGAVLGVILGVVFGAALQNVLAGQGLGVLRIPVGQLVAFVVVAGLVGVLAALWPAWRASRIDVLRAITTE